MAHDVIMPALGMAQETGLILSWRKQQGDAVKAGDVLMEVETDKAAMEVEAQADGFLTEIRRGEGEDVPVGEVIAVISDSKDAPAAAPSEAPKAAKAEEKLAAAPKAESKPAEEEKPAPAAPAPAAKSAAPTAPHAPSGDRILASPKAKRLAKEQGLDLSRLAKAGHPQPYRSADLEVLAAMPQSGGGMAGTTRFQARASLPAEAFDRFCEWVTRETGADAAKVLACFAAGSLRRTTGAPSVFVSVAAPRKQPRGYADPDRVGLSRLEAADEVPAPDIVVYDLTATRLTDADLSGVDAPTLTVARDGDRLVVALAASAEQMSDYDLVGCLDAFAGRLDEPLRHLI